MRESQSICIAKDNHRRDRRVGSEVTAVVAYAEDPGSIPASLQFSVTAILGYPVPSELCGYQVLMVHIHICYENIHIHKIHRTWYRMKVWHLGSLLHVTLGHLSNEYYLERCGGEESRMVT